MQCNRTYERLLEKEKNWLDKELIEGLTAKNDSSDRTQVDDTVNVVGRPRKSWNELRERSRRSKASGLAKDNCTGVLVDAAQRRAKSSPGMKDMSNVLKTSKVNPTKAKKSLDFDDKKPVMMSNEEALALKVNLDLSDQKYQALRNNSIIQNANIYPPLKNLLSAKSSCYPENIEIGETYAKIPLQNMAEHLLKRILKLQSKDIAGFNNTKCSLLENGNGWCLQSKCLQSEVFSY